MVVPARAGHWKLRSTTMHFPGRPLLMGIINVTPDSFSDGGRLSDEKKAVDHALRLVDEGADLLDVGGESTRPYATPVDVEEELRRVTPILEALCERSPIPISIDTSKAAVAKAALELGAQIINDVTGLEADPKMIEVAREGKAGICVMHMQGTPQTMQDNPSYRDVVKEVLEYLGSRRDELLLSGIDSERICMDPGIGFGKTHQHNLKLLASCHQFHALGCPLLVGHSRKGFISKVIGDKAADRAAGTIGVTLSLATQGVQVIRVHDVLSVRHALLLFEATGGMNA